MAVASLTKALDAASVALRWRGGEALPHPLISYAQVELGAGCGPSLLLRGAHS